MISKGRSSITAGGGGGTSNTSANRTTTSLRRQGGGRQATTRRIDLAIMRSIGGGKPAGQSTNMSNALLRNTQNNTGRGGGTLNYIKIKQLTKRRHLNNKKGKLTDREINMLVKDWHDKRAEEDLNQTTVEMEMKAMERTLAQFNMEQLGNIPIQKEARMIMILVC